MRNNLRIVLIAGATLIAAACASDMATSPLRSSAASAALISAPISFDQIRTSFVVRSSTSNEEGFVPGTAEHDGDNDGDHEDGEHGLGFGSLMGGGLSEHWNGGIGFGGGFRGPFGDFDDAEGCTFSTTTNRVVCPTLTRRGLTIDRSFSFLDAAGAVQQAFNSSTTNTVNVQTSVVGTRTHHQTAKSDIKSSSDFTIGGLASGSTKRTVDGKSAGTESTTGTKDGVGFTAQRSAGDTTTGLVIPIQAGVRTYPTAGTVIRSMKATITPATGTASTSSRREVITYDGSATAKVVITQDGVTKNCTKPLPHGRLTCS
jgi:hypothetical protein